MKIKEGETNPLKYIRAYCIECSGGSAKEADNCVIPRCELYPFRRGKNPFKKKRVLTPRQKETLRKNAYTSGKNYQEAK